MNPITFSEDGRLFVALDFFGDALYELDPELSDPPRLIAENLGWLNGFDWGSDGFLYGPIWTKGQVVRVDVDSGEITPVVEGLGVPSAVKFNSAGQLHVLNVLDPERGEVLRVDIETGASEVLAQVDTGVDNLAFNSEDRLFVSSAGQGSIIEVLPGGDIRQVSRGGMIIPGGVTVVPHFGGESVLVADFYSLRKFDGLTGQQRSVTRQVFGTSELISMNTVAPHGENLVLSYGFGSEVQVWNPKDQVAVETFHDMEVPVDAISFQGDLVASLLLTSQVVRVSDRTPLASGLAVPSGLAASDDDLWVADWALGTVLQIVADGDVLTEPRTIAEGLSFPEGLAVALDGSLLVVETGEGRLTRIDPATGEMVVVVDGLALGSPAPAGAPPTWFFSGVAMGPSGAIYVTGDIGNVLYRIEPR